MAVERDVVTDGLSSATPHNVWPSPVNNNMLSSTLVQKEFIGSK